MRHLAIALLLAGCSASPQYAPCSYEIGCGPPGAPPCENECPAGFFCRRFENLEQRNAVPGRQGGYCSALCARAADCPNLGGLLPTVCEVGDATGRGGVGACYVAQGCSVEAQCPSETSCGGDGWCEP